MPVRLEAIIHIKKQDRARIQKHRHQTPLPMHTFIVIIQSYPSLPSLSRSLPSSPQPPYSSFPSSSQSHLDQKVQTATTSQTRHHRRADPLPSPRPASPPIRIVPLRRRLVVHPPLLRRVSAPVTALLLGVAVALRWAVAAVLGGVSDLVGRVAAVVLVGDGGAVVFLLLLLLLGRRVGAGVGVRGWGVGGWRVFVRHCF